MSALSPYLRRATDRIFFWCPGCDQVHSFVLEGAGPKWTWNGDIEKPTFSPSLLIRSGHYIPGHEGSCWCTYNAEHPDDVAFKCSVCHSFVTDGMIQFLGDCTHALAGQTVPLPPWPAQE